MSKNKKMGAYSKNGKPKYKEKDFDDGRKKKSKIREQMRNANRSLKKSKRQELKNELRDLIP